MNKSELQSKIFRKINSAAIRIRSNLWRLNYKKWFYNIQDESIDRPIFLLGVQGGGLTLLSRILRRNKHVVSCTGNCHYWNGPDEMQNVLASELPEDFRLQNHSLSKHLEHGLGWRYASDEFLPYFRKIASDVTEHKSTIFRRTIKELILLHGSGNNNPRFIDKSQTFTLKIPFIEEIFKKEKPFFLLITRNPFAMIPRAAQKTNLSGLPITYEKKWFIRLKRT